MLSRCRKSVIVTSDIRAMSAPWIIRKHVYCKIVGQVLTWPICKDRRSVALPEWSSLWNVAFWNLTWTEAYRIDGIACHLEPMPVRELLMRVKAQEDKATIAGGFKQGDSLMSCVPRWKNVSRCSKKMFWGFSSNHYCGYAVANLSTKLNFTMRAVGTKLKIGCNSF